jgi:hypothetical protein
MLIALGVLFFATQMPLATAYQPNTMTLELHEPTHVYACPPEELCDGMCSVPEDERLRQKILDTLGLSDVYTDDDGTLVYVCKACTGFQLKAARGDILKVKLAAIA